MPLYICNSIKGTIPATAKSRIATEITDIHCQLTGAPRTFVHVFFLEDATMPPLSDYSVMLMGSIRHGRDDDTKISLTTKMSGAIAHHASLDNEKIGMTLLDVPASWVMEGGEVLPEPGEEEQWLKHHQS